VLASPNHQGLLVPATPNRQHVLFTARTYSCLQHPTVSTFVLLQGQLVPASPKLSTFVSLQGPTGAFVLSSPSRRHNLYATKCRFDYLLNTME
jgi:hypothetical protein